MPEETKELPKSHPISRFGVMNNLKSKYKYLAPLKKHPAVDKKAENSMMKFNMFLDDQAKRQK